MGRRRLRLSPFSSDEENETENHPPPPPPPPPPRPDPSNTNTNDGNRDNLTPEVDGVGVDLDPHPPHPVAQYLRGMGLRLSNEWLMDCLSRLHSSVQGFQTLDVPAISKLCFHQFLFSDMNFSAAGAGVGVLPPNLSSMHLSFLPGPFVLQVDEIVNISCPLKGRYQPASAGIKRCLKLSLTDGVQRVFGMEYRPIKDLDPLAPAGLKVVVSNVHVRRGLLMLVPECIDVLGGVVDELEAARQRLVNEVNKPPRGRRTRSGVVPPLATRATLAAWPPTNDVNTTHNVASPMAAATFPQTETVGVSSIPAVVNSGQRSSASSTVPSGRGNMVCQQSSNFNSDLEEMHVDTVPVRTADAMSNAPENIVANFKGMHMDSRLSINRPTVVSNSEHDSVTAAEERQVGADAVEAEHAFRGPCSDAISGMDGVQIIDGSEHPLLLSGDQEIPFTYLASLSAKWVAMKDEMSSVQGKIKCFLTGVKGFQYKKRTSYELLVYVDDGSLISEISIDHNKAIGHPPDEVTAALSSPDKSVVGCMREKLKQFQYFLANFEGIMLIEMNASSPFPVAIEMNEGCSASDPWLLLRRLKSFTTERTAGVSSVQPIELSP